MITFPHMGNVYLALKAAFDGLGVEYIIPENNNKSTIEIGSLYSPEEICLPFKLILGNYIDALEKGADTILIAGSCGPCRFGEYSELLIKTLNKLGYNPDVIVLDVPTDIGFDEFINRIRRASGGSEISKAKKTKVFLTAKAIMTNLDKIEEKAHMLAGYEVNKGDCKHILTECKKEALKCNTPDEMLRLVKSYNKKLENVEIDEDKNPLKIAIIGEIYTIIEPFSNLCIEDRLMDYGVSSKRKITPTWWFNDMILKPIKLNSLDIKYNAKEYLSVGIGGHAKECIGEAVMSHKEGLDGAIQIFPLGCMPEIISKSILPTIQNKNNFPIMTLIVDEMTGEAGYVTRIEAFLDMLDIKRKSLIRA